MATSPDVLILGGGVIGLTTAYFLAKAGLSVEVVDQGDFGRESSWAGAGIIPPGNPATARTPLEQLRAFSATRFPSLSAELREQTGIDNGYLRCGGLLLLAPGTRPDDEWHAEGIAFQRLGPEQARALEPALAAENTEVIFLPDMAQLRNPRHLRALEAACAVRGVGLRPGCPIHELHRVGDRVLAARGPLGEWHAGQFLIATGAWSDSLLAPLGWRPGIRPIRGQIALLHAAPPLLRRIVIDAARYLVPRPDGRVLVGSTEEDVGFDRRTTAAAIADLIGLAVRWVPGLASAALERCWAGLRPGSPDGWPFLGPVPGWRNVWVAAGHFRSGIHLSPATAQLMLELLRGQTPSLPVEPFRLDRRPPS
ncbi:MAG: glycine oxidase ThiO [Gemmataceae bacterium]|nr:glycine oxidase ThiO [Gemmataceae bacterium]MDW8264035.1 glycine oxidase ThiO [Gemmataceae bacterium]